MKMKVVIKVVLILYLVHSGCPTTVNVNNSTQLQGLFCDYQYEFYNDDIILLLNTSITHEITSGKYCALNISHTLTITSNSTHLASIICIPGNSSAHNDKYWTRGFAFYGTNGTLIMHGLNFTNCGTNLTTLDSVIINSTSSPIHFTQYHAAVLVFTNIANLIVENMAITSYNGFAIIAMNLRNATFSNLYIAYSQNYELATSSSISTGGGVLIVICNQRDSSFVNHYSIKILNSNFYKNFAFNQYYHKLHCIAKVHSFYRKTSMPVINAAGLTILYTQSDVPATVAIIGSNFNVCRGYLAGALMILRLNSSVSSNTDISSCSFSNNSVLSHCHGAAIAGNFYAFSAKVLNFKFYQPLIVDNTTFVNNGYSYKWSSGAINIALTTISGKDAPSILLLFRNLTFTGNEAQTSGSCMYVSTYTITGYFSYKDNNPAYIVMESINAQNNHISFDKVMPQNYIPVSVFNILYFNSIIINGTALSPGFYSYNYGSVFEIIDSSIILEGKLTFSNNIGNHGAALSIQGLTNIFLSEGVEVKFVNNSAQSLGGAIYATGGITSKNCTFQVLSMNLSSMSLSFESNTAELAGDSIYSSRLYKCSIKIAGKSIEHTTVYKKVFKNLKLQDLASYANSIELYGWNQFYEVYPGATVHIPISIRDNDNRPTYALVTTIAAEKQNKLRRLDWWFSNNQQISIGRNNYTIINVTIHTRDPSTFNRMAMMLFSISDVSKVNGVNITLKHCPPGFSLDPVTGTCKCSLLLLEVAKIYHGQEPLCNIENNSFTRSTNLNLWIGTNSTGNEFRISYCNPSYCNVGSQFDALFLNKSGPYLKSSISAEITPLCHSSRTGDLCGECISNYSVVFGSTECKHCSSKWWLLTSIIYVIAGPLLILLLYAFKLTLTVGTLNGIIFYAQIANVGVMRYLNTPCSRCGNEVYFVRLPSIFISWLNLNLGFPLCFSSEMTELWKSGLSLFFPVYLLLIVGFLIILSRLSSKVSNLLSKSSVQVLVTVVHLSFTQLLQAILDVFSSAYIYVENEGKKKVWLKNGSIAYGSIEHKRLMIVTSVVVGLILMPYMVIVLFGKHLLKFDRAREYIRPFYEAIHAPYKTNKWYWFGIYQTFVLLVYILEAIGGGHNLYLLFFLILMQIFQIFVIFQAFSMPFKSKLLNTLNLALLLLLNVVYLNSWYISIYMPPKYLTFFIAASIYPIIVTFCIIIVYHTLLITGQLGRLPLIIEAVKKVKTCFDFKDRRRLLRGTRQRHPYDEGSFFDDQYCYAREPLLERTIN